MSLDPVIPILGFYSKEILTHVQKDLQCSITVIVKNWEQPKCQSIRELIKETEAHPHYGILCGHQ